MGGFTSGLFRGVVLAGAALAVLSYAFPPKVPAGDPAALAKAPEPAKAAPDPAHTAEAAGEAKGEGAAPKPDAPAPAEPQKPEVPPPAAPPASDNAAAPAPAAPNPQPEGDAGQSNAPANAAPSPAASGAQAKASTGGVEAAAQTPPAPLAPAAAVDPVPAPAPEPTAKTVQLGNANAPAALEPAAAPLPPIEAYAVEFKPSNVKPLFALILQDIGDAGVDRTIAASLPYPVTFAIDPESPFAAEAMAQYRAAGKEVVILPSALPEGANASDVEMNLSTYAQMMPETVAFLSGAGSGFQDDLALAKLAIPAIGAQGRGVLLLDKGLNSARQIAQRGGIAFALISKIIDAEGESVPVMRRYLDRAVFRARQDGSTAVMGTLRPDTLTALTEWTLEGNGSAVQMAPVTALMK